MKEHEILEQIVIPAAQKKEKCHTQPLYQTSYTCRKCPCWIQCIKPFNDNWEENHNKYKLAAAESWLAKWQERHAVKQVSMTEPLNGCVDGHLKSRLPDLGKPTSEAPELSDEEIADYIKIIRLDIVATEIIHKLAKALQADRAKLKAIRASHEEYEAGDLSTNAFSRHVIEVLDGN